MIQGRKPNGYLVTADAVGRRIERETRMCVHCQFIWEYDPFAEASARTIRGFCLRCFGFTCERPECHREQQQVLAAYPDRPCISFEEHYRRRLDAIAKHPLWEVTPAGILVAKSEVSEIPGLEGIRTPLT